MVNAGDGTEVPQSDVDAGQVLERVLQLIDDTASIDQITAERVSAALGAQVRHTSDRDFGYGARLTSEWMYRVDFRGNPRLGPVLVFRIFNPDGSNDGSLSEVSQLDYDQFAARLQSSGFTQTPQYGEHGRLMGSSFTRDGLTVEVSVRGESEQNPTRLCVQTVQVR